MNRVDLVAFAVICQSIGLICLSSVILLRLRGLRIERRQIYDEIMELQDSDRRRASELPQHLRPTTRNSDPGRDAHG